jgi:tetratricopeptide (TPR) repeat protein
MSIDLYAPCPCGSGKKFKWCCQPIHVLIDKAFRLDSEGQHDAALKSMEEVCAQHGDNPEVWGRKALLLYQMGKAEEAEDALEKAFALNPKYPFGFYLRGRFRHVEGEIRGALLLFRKAVESYDPIATGILAQLQSLIADCEWRLNRPLAARAALRMMVRLDPANPSNAEIQEGYFGKESGLPSAATKEYTLRALPDSAAPDIKTAWTDCLEKAATGALNDAAKAFEELTTRFPQEPAAWYNLGLAKAWQGDNAAALTALQSAVELDTDEERAAEAWNLAEVVLLGDRMQDHADHVRHTVIFQVRDMDRLFNCFRGMEEGRRLLGMKASPEEGLLTGIVLEKVQGLTLEHTASKAPRLGAYLTVAGPFLRLSNTDRASVQAVADEIRTATAGALSEGNWQSGPPNFVEILSEALVFPIYAADEQEASRKVVEYFASYMEEHWIHKPLKSLGNVAPIDAAGHGVLRRKLRGIIQFLADCTARLAGQYDYDKLRRKLGLLGGAAAAPAAPGLAVDYSAMSTPELASLQVESLPDNGLEQAFQSALKLDASELAAKFARTLLSRPAAAGADRFPQVSHLIRQALAEGKTDEALAALAEGETLDSAHNEGKRAAEYAQRRGQIHAKRGEIDQAMAAFERMIAAAPNELRFQGSAAEAMLSAKQPDKALHFAEGGLKKSRQQNNRDSEQYFQELASAARKQSV